MTDEQLVDLVAIADDSGADVLCDAAACEVLRRLSRVEVEAA